jgi:hypothetical protein
MVTATYWYFKEMPDQVGHDENVIAGLTGNLKSII